MAEYLSPIDQLNPVIKDVLLNRPTKFPEEAFKAGVDLFGRNYRDQFARIDETPSFMLDVLVDAPRALRERYVDTALTAAEDLMGVAKQNKPRPIGNLPANAAVKGTGPRGNTVGSDADPNTPGLQGPGAPGASTTKSQPGGTKAPGYDKGSTTNYLNTLSEAIVEQLRAGNEQNAMVLSEEYRRSQLELEKERLAHATDLLSKAQMGQMREKTRRDVIDGWRKIQQEKIRANTVMATAMMNTAYLAATPNANVLSALNVASDSAMRAFQPGQAVN